MNQEKKGEVVFTHKEIRAFRFYAVEVTVMAAVMYFVVPKGAGQIVALLFALILLPVPPLAIYMLRRCKAAG
jgi:hypothetical protein